MLQFHTFCKNRIIQYNLYFNLYFNLKAETLNSKKKKTLTKTRRRGCILYCIIYYIKWFIVNLHGGKKRRTNSFGAISKIEGFCLVISSLIKSWNVFISCILNTIYYRALVRVQKPIITYKKIYAKIC